MHPGVITCAPDTPLTEVARIISTKHIHCLVISDEGEIATAPSWAMVSALDLVAAAPAGFEERTAREIAASDPVMVSSDERLYRAAQMMVEHQVEHLIVVGASDGRPVGVLSTLDIAGVMAWGDA